MGKPWENGDSYGKIHHVQWVNQLFRLGHVQVRKLLVRLPEGIYYCIVSDKKHEGSSMILLEFVMYLSHF